MKELKRRLKKRGYHKEKIEENLECEIMDVCLEEAREKGHEPLELDGTKAWTMKRVVNLLSRGTKSFL